jgi:hypothetical protein
MSSEKRLNQDCPALRETESPENEREGISLLLKILQE